MMFSERKPSKADGSTPEGRAEIAARLVKLGAYELVTQLAIDHSVAARAILSRDRNKYVVAARFHLWAVIRWTLDMSLQEMARLFGRDHTTIMHGIRVHESRIQAKEAA